MGLQVADLTTFEFIDTFYAGEEGDFYMGTELDIIFENIKQKPCIIKSY